MKYRLLGKSGLRVSEICLGTMTFGEEWGWGSTDQESRNVFDVFAEAGGNFLDTANIYTNGTSEKIVGQLISSERDKWVLATKYSLNNEQLKLNQSGNHRKNMMQSVNASLKRLNTDYIDLLYLHIWDFTTPVEEVMRGFDDLVSAGKILYVGFSDTPAWIVTEANTIAQFRGWAPIIAMQIEYSLIERTPERDVIPMSKHHDIAITAWGPLGAGVLTGKYNKGNNNKGNNSQKSPKEKGRLATGEAPKTPTQKELQIAQEVVKIAQEIGRKPSQVALNWLRQQHTSIIPIVGARKAAQLKESLGCLDFTLSPEYLMRLNQISAIDLGFPHDFFQSKVVQDFAFGGALKLIEEERLSQRY